jgi:hypothetical protein
LGKTNQLTFSYINKQNIFAIFEQNVIVHIHFVDHSSVILFMKLFKIGLSLAIILFFSIPTFADVGCRSGDFIYTVTTGGSHNNGSEVLPEYAESSAVYLRTFAGDPSCGFLKTTALAYPTAPGTPVNPNSKCSHSGQPNDISTLVIYDPADNTCNVPFDSHFYILGLALSCFGFFCIKTKEE